MVRCIGRIEFLRIPFIFTYYFATEQLAVAYRALPLLTEDRSVEHRVKVMFTKAALAQLSSTSVAYNLLILVFAAPKTGLYLLCGRLKLVYAVMACRKLLEQRVPRVHLCVVSVQDRFAANGAKLI